MWLFLSDAFLSIVAKDCRRDQLLVRARRIGDIEKIFPEAYVTTYTKSDYLYRAVVSRSDVENAIINETQRVIYGNFKNSVKDPDLHNAYMRVWTEMSKLQSTPPYSGGFGSMLDFDIADDDLGLVTSKPKAKKKTKKSI